MENLRKKKPSDIEADLMVNINWSSTSKIWLGFLCSLFVFTLWFYVQQIRNGLGVTGLSDFVSWGIYISNFVFFVATSLIGMLISSVLGLMGAKWIQPIARIAEIIAVAFALVSGLVIVTDMGRPDRLLNVFLYGRVQSPIVWDISVVITYVMLSVLLLYVPLIPDLNLIEKHKKGLPKLQIRIYKFLSMGWADSPQQYAKVKKYIRMLSVLIIPVALSIHTVTSWLFAMTLRAGWDSPIFGPYFVSGAFVAGSAAVIVMMYIFRLNFGLQDYVTDEVFDHIGKLLVLVSLVYVYFNINEILVPAYKLKEGESDHLTSMLYGHDSLMFWMVQIGGLILPFTLLLFGYFRKPLPATILSVIILIGAWFKRFLIVVPVQLHPYLPIQNVPESFAHYSPTLAEISITASSFILVLIIITVLAKTIPLVPIWEMKEAAEELNEPEKHS